MRPNLNQYPRVGGLIIAMISLFLCKISIFDVLEAAGRSESHIEFTQKGVVLGSAMLALGLLMLVFGESFRRLCQSPEGGKPGPVPWILGLFLAGFGFAVCAWMKSKLQSLGYNL